MILSKIRATKKSKSTSAPQDGNEMAGGNGGEEKGISHSERSYGATKQYFRDLVETLAEFGDYKPPNASLGVVALQNRAEDLDDLMDQVIKKYHQLRSHRSNRLKLYEELSDRVQHIKSYVLSKYGATSQEYQLIKGIEM